MTGLSELMHWLDPAALSAALTKPRLCDEQLLRRHLQQRLAHCRDDQREAARDAALAHFGEPLN